MSDIKSVKINNRRFLGNKYKLLPFITNVVDEECRDIKIVADIFAGTGSVASAFIDRQIITNDILYCNYICNYAWFAAERYDKKKIIDIISYYNSLVGNQQNYMTENFADTYFSYSDCSKIGIIREDIEEKIKKGLINSRERAILITSLIYGMDRIAKTCGHYDAYRKGAVFDLSLFLFLPEAKNDNNKKNACYNEDANELVKHIKPDLVYIDPPYNSRQYCDTYHLLENIALWQKPSVYGTAKKMDRSKLKSLYCTRKAPLALADLVANISSKYILFSYNNMGKSGDDRSNARISDSDIIQSLQNKGEVKIFSMEYKSFTTGKSERDNNQERLFLCKCKV